MGDLLFLLFAVVMGFFFYKRSLGQGGPKENRSQSPRDKVLKAETGQDFTIFEDILDNVIKVDSQRFRAVLWVDPLNWPMYSFNEKKSIKERFRRALFGVRYGFMFYVASLRNDPSLMAERIQRMAERHEKDGLSRMAYYGADLARYVTIETIRRAPIEPGYYFVINYDEIDNVKGYSEEIIYQQALTELNTRALSMIEAFGRAELKAYRLNTDELTDLMHFAFNRDSNSVSIKQATKAGLFGLYTTEKGSENIDPQSLNYAEELAGA